MISTRFKNKMIPLYVWGVVIFCVVLFVCFEMRVTFGQAAYIAIFSAIVVCFTMNTEYNKMQNMIRRAREYIPTPQPASRAQTIPDVPSRTAEKGEYVCPVCLDSVVNMVLNPCGHAFCALCIRAYTRTNNSCPMCRTPVEGGVRLYLSQVLPPTSVL
jgi:hypothetical protein